ncbi:MAG: carboxypeptidase M32 [Nanoarchaeota archaeon]|nr:carboxypeptidase M32 [Nanoarchaeota archaeon]MBU1029947.1 carboxypeptidase M32 [Nanoarchaeota archaeon]MBU1849230.1 carboxypeptidase M32 [Nanoarchaeota archaeon]
MKEALKLIQEIQKEVFLLHGVIALLDWDEKTYMPKKGIGSRSEQVSIINSLAHKKIVSNELFKTLKKLSKKKLSKKDSIIVKRLLKDVIDARKLPQKFVEELSKESIITSGIWQKARKENDFEIFKLALKKMINLKRKQAKYINPKAEAYDVLIDNHEEGMTAKKLTEIFTPLKKELIKILKDIKKTKQYKAQKHHHIKISEEEQKNLVKLFVEKMSVSWDVLSLDASAHPFTTRISEYDVRITTRFPDLMDAFFSTVHEAGHALYELNLPKEYAPTVIYEAPSMGIHESQSRFWENMICRNKVFWKGYFKTFNKTAKQKVTSEEFYNWINLVRPSYIRVDADEVTYCLHIILRFEIERDLINGKLSVDNARDEWNKKFKEMFGITPKSDNQGILQDIHWSMGAFGYFPSYAIGTIYSSQIRAKLKQEIKDFDSLVERQEFKKIILWLEKNIHSKGRTMLADEIIKKSTGKGLDPESYIKYLKDKYSKIYGF